MKALLNLFLLAAALSTAGGGVYGAVIQWGQFVTGVQLGVEVEERPFKPGERIPLSVKFTNSTGVPRFPVGPIHLAGQITVIDARQQPVRRREDLRLEAQAKAGKVVGAMRKPPPMYGAAIKPGGTLGYGLDLMKEFALDQPGTYHVSATGFVLSGLPFEQGSATHTLTSGMVVVQVVSNAPMAVAAVAPPAPIQTNLSVMAARPMKPTPPAPPAPKVEAPPARPTEVPAPAVAPPPSSGSSSWHFSRSLVMAGIFGVLGLLMLFGMFRSHPR